MRKIADERSLSNNQILVHYRDGPYGPEILIDTMTRESLSMIRTMFAELARGETNIINVLNGPEVVAAGVESFLCRTKANADNEEKNLEIRKSPSGVISAIWSLSAIGWWECVNLVDGLLECDSPAHQHLNEDREHVDDATIELAFRENVELRSQLGR